MVDEHTDTSGRQGPDAALSHPSWCDVSACTAGDPVRGEHRSTVRIVDLPGRVVDNRFEVYLSCTAYEPHRETTVFVELVIERQFGGRSVEQYTLESDEVRELAAVLSEHAALLERVERERAGD